MEKSSGRDLDGISSINLGEGNEVCSAMARRPEWTKLPLTEMLAQYGLGLYDWDTASSCLKVETNQGPFRLKRFAYPAVEFPFIYSLVEYLAERGFRHSEKIRLTKEGRPGLVVAGQFFYLATWQKGMTEFELDRNTLVQVGSLLGSLHRSSKGFSAINPVHPARIQWGIWPSKLTDRYHDLVQFAGLAGEGITAFDRLFKCQATAFLKTANGVLEELERLSFYREIVKLDEQARYVCHRDCIPGNIVKGPEGDLVLIDFDNAAYAEKIDDIAKLLRYFSGWEIDRARELIIGYQEWFPIRREEIKLLRIFLEFPMEYWQLGRFAYQRGRARCSALKKWVAASGAKARFLIDLERVIS